MDERHLETSDMEQSPTFAVQPQDSPNQASIIRDLTGRIPQELLELLRQLDSEASF